MNKLQKQTTDQLRRRRNLMLNAKAFSIDPDDRKAFQKAADGLEAQMYRKVKIMLIAVTVLVLVSILAFGCVSNTIDGLRQDINHWTAEPAHHK